MKNVLVTGGAGFIGSNFVRCMLLKEAHVRVVNLDALTYAGNLENLSDLPDPARYTFVQGDICATDDVVRLLRDSQIETIIHFAAETHVDRSILAPTPFIQTNVVGTLSLLEAARQVWLDKNYMPDGSFHFHHISTDEVYGSLEPGQPAWTEHSAYAPRSPYAASKAASDHLVRAFGHSYGLPYTITNCSNNYGPFQFPEKLIPLTILKALQGVELPIYGDGQQVRDWIHVDDHCEAIRLVLHKGISGETYHVSSGNELTNKVLVESVCNCLDEIFPRSEPYGKLITFVRDRPGHDRRYAMEARKLQQGLDWRPSFSFQAGLLQTVRWYIDHLEWVAAIRQRPAYQTWLKLNYSERESLP
jgi:dTDP-glucose 4,6-dehydratase